MSKKDGRLVTMLYTAIIEIPIVINKSSETTRSDKLGPIRKRINTKRVEMLNMGSMIYAKKSSKFIGLFSNSFFKSIFNAVDKLIFITDIQDRKSTRLNSSHVRISYAVFCLKKKNK